MIVLSSFSTKKEYKDNGNGCLQACPFQVCFALVFLTLYRPPHFLDTWISRFSKLEILEHFFWLPYRVFVKSRVVRSRPASCLLGSGSITYLALRRFISSQICPERGFISFGAHSMIMGVLLLLTPPAEVADTTRAERTKSAFTTQKDQEWRCHPLFFCVWCTVVSA